MQCRGKLQFYPSTKSPSPDYHMERTYVRITYDSQKNLTCVSSRTPRSGNNYINISMYFRLLLYVKLFAVMGVSWILEVISHIFPEANKIWCFTDAYNVLIGLLVFIIFVCKRKIFRLMKKR